MTIAQAARTYELFVGIDSAATAVEVSTQRPGVGNLIGGFGSDNLFDCSLHMGAAKAPVCNSRKSKSQASTSNHLDMIIWSLAVILVPPANT